MFPMGPKAPPMVGLKHLVENASCSYLEKVVSIKAAKKDITTVKTHNNLHLTTYDINFTMDARIT